MLFLVQSSMFCKGWGSFSWIVPELLYALQSQLSSWSPVLTPTATMMIKVHAATVRIYDAIISSLLCPISLSAVLACYWIHYPFSVTCLNQGASPRSRRRRGFILSRMCKIVIVSGFWHYRGLVQAFFFWLVFTNNNLSGLERLMVFSVS